MKYGNIKVFKTALTSDQCFLSRIALIQIGVFLEPSGRQIVLIPIGNAHTLVGLDDMLEPMNDLLVQNVEAHRGQRHAGHDVRRAEPERRGGFFAHPRHQIAKPDGRQAHEAEIDGIDQRPVLKTHQRDRAQHNVDDHHAQAEQYRRQQTQAMHRGARFARAQRVDFDVNVLLVLMLLLFVRRMQIIVH